MRRAARYGTPTAAVARESGGVKLLATLALVCAVAFLLPASATASSVENGYGTFKVGNWPGADWRPYADGTPFNAPVPASPGVHPNSQNIVSKLMSYGMPDNMSVPAQEVVEGQDPLDGDYAHPTYYSEPDDPWKQVTCLKYGGGCEIKGEWVQIPEQAEPAHGGSAVNNGCEKCGDDHMTIVDQRKGIEYDFWQVQEIGANHINISSGGKTDIKGDGLDSGATAGHFGNLAGVIRAQELAAGKIDHALFMVVKCTNGEIVYPAKISTGRKCSDIGQSNANAPAMGQRFQLNMTYNEVEALKEDGKPVPQWKKTILHALREYGAYVGDTGCGAWCFQFESGQTYWSFGHEDPLVQFSKNNNVPYYRPNDRYAYNLRDSVDWAGRLRVLDPPSKEPPPPATTNRLAGVETGNFKEFDGNSKANATIGVTSKRAYTGTRSVSVLHSGENDGFARAWFGVDWNTGTDVWYGAAFYIPDKSAVTYADLIRWDNYDPYEMDSDPGRGDTGGLFLENGRMALARQDYGGSNYAELGPRFDFPEKRWFWVEVHQRFSSVNGQALSEVYVDGRRVARSTLANSRGREITTIRYGYVSVAPGPASSLFFDRASVSASMRGPK